MPSRKINIGSRKRLKAFASKIYCPKKNDFQLDDLILTFG
jgi:hypothetical protein